MIIYLISKFNSIPFFMFYHNKQIIRTNNNKFIENFNRMYFAVHSFERGKSNYLSFAFAIKLFLELN